MNFPAEKPEGSKGNKYLSLKDGDSHTGVLRGEPHDYRSHYVGKYLVCPEDKSCLHCAGGPASFRFAINFVVKENGALVAKVWEQGRRVYDALDTLQKTGYDLEKTFVKISRKGSGADDTVYSVAPLPEHKVTADQLGELDKVQLHVLSGKPKDSMGDFPPAMTDEDQIPF